MQIPLNVLLYHLAASSNYATLNVDLAEAFDGIKLFDVNSCFSAYDDISKKLYLVNPEELINNTEKIRAYNVHTTSVFLCITTDDTLQINTFSDVLSVILLYTPHSFVDIFNRILNIFYNFDVWDKSFHLALLRDCNMQELLDLSQNILVHPMVVLDSNFTLLGYFNGDTTKDPIMEDILNAGYVTPQIMTRLRQDGLISTSENADNPLINYYCLAPNDCYYSMMYRFTANNHVVGYALIFQNQVHPKANYLHLMNMVAENLNLYFQQQRFRSRMSSEMYESILTEILDNPSIDKQQFIDQLSFVPDLKMDGYFLLARLNYDNSAELPYSFVSWSIRNTLPFLKPFIYDNSLYILKTCSESNAFQPFLADGEKKSFKKIFKSGSFTCTISNLFFSLMDLSIATMQCKEAMNIPVTENENFYYFKDVLLKYVLKELKSTTLLPMIESPHYRILKQYDENHNTDLCELFMYYLQNGRNVNQTSAVVFLHRNTVLNKVKKAISVMQSECEDYQEYLAFLLSYFADHV